MLITAGYAAVQGGKAVKKQIQRRKNPSLEGDFILTQPPERKSLGASVKDAKKSLVSSTNEMRRRSISKLSQFFHEDDIEEGEGGEGSQRETSTYSIGQEVILQNMQDTTLNGSKALVLQDFGKCVLVQFLEKKEGHDNYMETRMRVSPENIAPIRIRMEGTLVELQNLKALHMNGLRGTIVCDNDAVKPGRVAVKLLEGDIGIISVKLDNCRIVGGER